MTPVTDPLILKQLENARAADLQSADPNALADPNTGQLIPRLPGGTSTPGTDFLYGLRKPIDNLAVLGGRAIEGAGPALGFSAPEWTTGLRAGAQEAASKARQSYEQTHAGGPPDDSALMRAGEMIVPTALGYAMPGSTSASFLPRTASNAFTGAVTSLMTGDPNASPTDLAGQAALGAGLGAGISMLTGGAARVAEPRMSMPGSDVRNLMDIGVRPTIGQASGGALNRVEQGLANTIPLAGDLIKAARRRSVLDLNTGVMNDVLAPIKEELPKGMEVGRDALNYMADRVSDAYNRAVPTAGALFDGTAETALQRLKNNAQFLPDAQRGQFNRYIDQYVDTRLGNWGSAKHLSGDSFKAAESDLGKAANGYLYNRNSDFNDLQLGEKLREAQSILRENLARSSPQAAADIAAANQAFARMQTVSKAVARPTVDPGVFSPAQLQGAAYGGTLSRNARMRGTGPYQELSDSARSVLGPTIPDSGTPFGMAVRDVGGLGLLGSGTASGHITPETLAAAAAGVGGLGAAYNPWTQPLIAHLMATRHPMLRALANPIHATAPIVTTGAASGLLGP
jgi:hypothetical protein